MCFSIFNIYFFVSVAANITITELLVPPYLEYELPPKPVLLDCVFQVDNDKNVVVKWFFKDTNTLIYQWIPDRDKVPEAVGKWKDKVDLNHRVSNDTNTMYRALYIKEISLDISGPYICKISSDTDEKEKSKPMIIYGNHI